MPGTLSTGRSQGTTGCSQLLGRSKVNGLLSQSSSLGITHDVESPLSLWLACSPSGPLAVESDPDGEPCNSLRGQVHPSCKHRRGQLSLTLCITRLHSCTSSANDADDRFAMALMIIGCICQNLPAALRPK